MKEQSSLNATCLFAVQVAAEIAAPLAQTKKVTMVSTGNGDVGAAKLTGEVMEIMQKLPHVVQDMTGVDISKVMIAGKSMLCSIAAEMKSSRWFC